MKTFLVIEQCISIMQKTIFINDNLNIAAISKMNEYCRYLYNVSIQQKIDIDNE